MNNKKQLIISTWNVCNGLLNKVDYVKDLLTENNIDILFLQETEVHKNTNTDLLGIPGYTIEFGKSSETIRIVAYVKNGLKYTRIIEPEDGCVIMLNIAGNYAHKQVCGLYRPFKMVRNLTRVDDWRSQIQSITDFIKTEESVMIVGDFNLDYDKLQVQNYTARVLYDHWLETVYAFDLEQLVYEPTWSRVYQGLLKTSILDHVYVNNICSIEEIKVEKQPISDHAAIIVLTTGAKAKKRGMSFQYTCWKNYSAEKLRDELAKFSFEDLIAKDCQTIADEMDQILGTIRDTLLTTKTVKNRNVDASYPGYILEMKTKLRNMHKRAKKTANIALILKCKTFEKRIRSEIMKSKMNKVRAESKLGPKNLWKAVKIATNRPVGRVQDITTDGVNLITEDKIKADVFAKHFDETVKRISVSNKPSTTAYLGKRKIFGNYDQNWVTEDLVKTIMQQLTPKRCEGYDRIPLVFYRDGINELLPVITSLMEKVLSTGKVPEQWKVAKVLPLHKKGKLTDVANYRPISNLCSITKIFERLILGRLNYIETNENTSLTGDHQHGFKKGRSTVTTCLELQSKIAQSCDKQEYATVATVDMSAAFDVVDHDLLLKRLVMMGLPKQLTEILKDWLTGRYFYCDINGSSSCTIEINCGTVQGSILGPILYAMFTSPVEDIVDDLSSFADDNFQFASHKEEKVSIEKCLTKLSKVIQFLEMSGLKINIDKTEICVFHTRDIKTETVMISGRNYEIKKTMKILGVIFDAKLTWHDHVNYAIQGANRAKQALSLISKYFTSQELLVLATAYFYGKLYYAAEIWLHSGIKACLKKHIWQSSSRMLQIVDKDRERLKSFVNLHKQYKRATPVMWSNYVTAVCMFNVMKQIGSDQLLPMASLNVLHNARRAGPLFTRSNNLKIGFNCMTNRLQVVSSRLSIDWTAYTKEHYKIMCKRVFILEELLKL